MSKGIEHLYRKPNNQYRPGESPADVLEQITPVTLVSGNNIVQTPFAPGTVVSYAVLPSLVVDADGKVTVPSTATGAGFIVLQAKASNITVGGNAF